jgi:hypothetical protein
MKKILEIFLLASIFQLSRCQIFTVQIHHQVAPSFSYVLQCFGAFFGEASFLVPATCLNPVQSSYLSVLFQDLPSRMLMTNNVVFSMHPDFNATNPSYGNVGVVRVSFGDEFWDIQ